MNLPKPKNINYCAIVVRLNTFVPLVKGDGGMLECGNVQGAIIRGSQVILSKDVPVGALGIFFPPEVAISKEFLGTNNLYRKAEFGNIDPTRVGFFEEHGRVRTMKFRGHKSEGFWIPIEALSYLGNTDAFGEGSEFDSVETTTGLVEICKKYVPKHNPTSTKTHTTGRNPRNAIKLVRGQFQFHIDTPQLKRNMHRLEPHQTISVSEKFHGTSAIFAHLLVNRDKTRVERFLEKIPVLRDYIMLKDTEYDYTWASRKVVKGIAGKARDGVHFYGTDIWADVLKGIKELIPKGFTLYGEIVGYNPNGGGMIQKGYHYGCEQDQYKFLIYRITSTNEDSKVLEFTWSQIRQFCAKTGIDMVPELYHGKAAGFGSERLQGLASLAPQSEEHMAQWQQMLLTELLELYVHDQMCPHNNFTVPYEGVVVKVENHLSEPESYKLKSFRFLTSESLAADAGEIDMETIEGEGE